MNSFLITIGLAILILVGGSFLIALFHGWKFIGILWYMQVATFLDKVFGTRTALRRFIAMLIAVGVGMALGRLLK
jgi:hypothetical protein